MLGTVVALGSSRCDVRGFGFGSMHRPVLSILTSCLLLVGLACSEEPPPGFENGTFGAAHRAEIENDCDKRVMCAQRSMMYLREDVWDHCVTTNAMNLNADPNFRFEWSLGVARCTQPDVCAYRDCVDSEYVSYGQFQLDKIDYTCMQKLQCSMENGSFSGDPNAYFETCRVHSIITLDGYTNEVRAAYQQQFFTCMAQTGCAFQLCFPY